MNKNLILVLLSMSLLTLSAGISGADIPENWTRVDHEGLFQQTDIQTPLKLSVFGSDLYAQAEDGLYKFNNSSFDWEKQTISLDDLSPFKSADFSQFPNETYVKPLLVFNGQLYAVVSPQGSTTFEIWRSPDFGKNQTSMTWNKVVSNGFGNPLNHELGLMIEYNSKLLVVTTNTRTDPNASFGDGSYYGPGIQVWESSSGDNGSWYQVNKDGFGTETTIFDWYGKEKIIRTNQDFGSGAVYNETLYIGTLSHYGGQVWSYNGTGLNGWKDVTPDTMIWNGPSRAVSMVVYNDSLYLGEGFPTGNIGKYDGANWEIAVSAGQGFFGHPFAVTNGGISSLAVANGKLYASTLRNPLSPYNPPYEFAQVWGYPYPYQNLSSTYAYITNAGSGTVTVIDTATDNVTATLSYVGSNPDGVAVSPDGKKVYVANSDWDNISAIDTVSVIDTATNTFTDMIEVGQWPWGIAVSPDGNTVYVTNDGSDTVSVINTSNNTVTATVPVGVDPRGIVVTPDGKTVYLTNSDWWNNISAIDTVFAIDTATNTVIANVSVGNRPWGVAVSPDGTKLYVANYGSNTTSVIDTATNSVAATVPVGWGPVGVAVSPDGEKVYVVSYHYPYTVSIIDTATNSVTATVNVGKFPHGVAFTPDGKKAYVTSDGSDKVYVIDTATNNVTATVNTGFRPMSWGQFIGPAPEP
jgi:YVTN family beta-propeller protein